MKLLLLINPKAGRNKGEQVANQAGKMFQQKGIQTELCFSEYAGHTVELARENATGDFDGIVAVGGDGTLFEIINGMIKADPSLPLPLGIIPVGTGNSFSKDLNITGLESAVDKICSSNTRKVDLGYFDCDAGSYYFINLLGFGFVADVAHKAGSYKQYGALSYVIGVFVITMNLQSYQLELTIDGKKYERENCFVEICNSTKTGGEMIMAPDAKIDDGLFDVIVLNRISKTGLLRAFPKIFRGTHLALPEIEVFKAAEVKAVTNIPKILTPDGEIFGHTPIDVKIFPKKITLFG